MERLADKHREVRLMDIAAGHGRYVLDAVAASPVRCASVLLRDYSDINVRDGRALIAEKELQDIAEFVQADAFDRLSLASVMSAASATLLLRSRACTSCSPTTRW